MAMIDLIQVKHRLYENAQVASLLLLSILLVLQVRSRAVSAALGSSYARAAALAIGVGSLLSLLFAVFCYLLYPNYLDHFEAVTAAISAKALGGANPYPDIAAGDLYEAPYGPLLFLVDGLFIKVVPSIAGSKLPGVLSFLATMVSLVGVLWAISKDRVQTILLAGLAAAIFLYMREDGTYVYWNRSEPFLLLIATLALLVCDRPDTLRSAFGLGVLAGCASGFKLHGAVYVLPVALGVIGGAQTVSRGLRAAAVLSATSLAVLLLPFAGHDALARMKGYAAVLSMTSRHGMLPNLFVQNILLALTMLAPSAFLLVMGGKTSRTTTLLAGGLAVSLLIAAGIGSKAGAGMHHMLPLVPTCLYVYARLSRESDVVLSPRRLLPVTPTILISVLYPYVYIGLKSAVKDARLIAAASRERGKQSELTALFVRYPDAQVGVSDTARFADSFYKALPVMRGGPYVIDFSSWADFRAAGYSDERLGPLVSSCRPRTWILPKGEPFTLTSPFGDGILLSDAFRRRFHAAYRKAEERSHFDVWVCKAPR